mmetsp:Transcript_17703/g.31233  ORF Transcript_17703/g.31233 Transcript_17703/m.31233 type:complete len:518 (+) Transcript_17703:151-1704(+)
MSMSGLRHGAATCSRTAACSRQLGTSASSRSAHDWLVKDAYIGGRWISAEDHGASYDVHDPGRGTVVATLPDLGASQVGNAVDAAEEALKKWRKTTGKERSEVLRKVHDLHKEHADELAEILAMESGKPLAEAKGEIMYGASYFEWFAEEAKRAYGDVIPEPTPGRKIFTFREPVGVCGLITPWNFPNAMIARKVAPAIASGCTVVIKPASETPLSTLAIAKMFEMAGVPDGVLNVVPGKSSSDIGGAMTSDKRVRKISFTGSTRVGKILLKSSADSVKKVSMELGGDAPFIVFDDADVDAAVEGLIAAKFRNAGQTCVCANRVYVQSGIFDEFADKFCKRVEALKVGWYKDDDVNVGPLITTAAVEKVSGLVEDAIQQNAKVLVGGKVLAMDDTKYSDQYYAPTVLTNCTDSMRVAKEEIFGPVAPLFKFETEEEVLERANNTDQGLAAYFFSADVARCFRVTQALESGMVGCNTGLISTEVAPFGGVKESGLGREGSKYGMDDYSELKYMALQLD